jgi:histidinol-phosphatase (PHP family)
MVLTAPPTIVGHLDKLKIQNHYAPYFYEHSELYQNEVLKTLDVIQKSRCFIEVNTRGLYKGKSLEPYPSVWILKAILERNIPIVLNSDAHVPREISLQFAEITALLKSIGFKTKKTLKKGVWINEYL